MAREISSCDAPFTTYPRAPARIAAKTDSSSSNMVSTSTATSGATRVISAVAAIGLGVAGLRVLKTPDGDWDLA